MSWDIFVQDLPSDARSTDDIPPDFVPQTIGSRGEIVSRIGDVAPSVDFSDPTWGRIETDSYTIEISISETDPVKNFAFHVRGSSEAAQVVADILDRLGLLALDPGAPGGIFSREAAEGSMTGWRDYRDGAAGE